MLFMHLAIQISGYPPKIFYFSDKRDRYWLGAPLT